MMRGMTESFLGVPDYAPLHAVQVADVPAADRGRLRSLTGLELRASWAVWDVRDDEWFTDAPLVLDFGQQRLELAGFKTHLCLAWDTIDVSAPFDWYGTDFELEWRRDAIAAVNALLGRPLIAVSLLVAGDAVHGLALMAGDAYLELCNALDELGATNTRGELTAVAV
jgi:hypothetical protein